jgi:hypothetical protein
MEGKNIADHHDRLVRGKCYYISDTDHESAKKFFMDLIASGHTGLYISRTAFEALHDMVELVDFQVALLQQHTVEGVDTISDLPGLLAMIKEFSETHTPSIILLDRVDYLLNTFSSEHVLRSFHQIHEIIAEYQSIFVIHVNPSVVNSTDLTLLKKGFIRFPVIGEISLR